MRYALIDDNGLVTNVILWDGETPWQPPAGVTVLECDDHVGPGWFHDGEAYVSPPEPEPEAEQ